MRPSPVPVQGKAAGIAFDYGVDFGYHPVDSQRLLLWAAAQVRLGRIVASEETMPISQ